MSTARRLSSSRGSTRISLRRKRSPEASRKKSRISITTPSVTRSVAWLNRRSRRVGDECTDTATDGGREPAAPSTLAMFSTCSVARPSLCIERLRSRSFTSAARMLCGARCIQSAAGPESS